MKRAFALSLALALIASPISAADLGGPKIPAPAAAAPDTFRPAIWTGCYADASAAGHVLSANLAATTVATAGIGLGCDYQAGPWVMGGRLGYDLGREDFRALTAGGRIGYTLNPHALVYGLATLTIDGLSLEFRNSMLSLGGGLELFALTKRSTLFLEVSKDAKQFGTSKDLSEAYVARAGVRARF